MLVFTLPEIAKEFRTSKENVYILEQLGLIKTTKYSSRKLVSKYEVKRFLIENAGKDFSTLISEEKKRKKIKDMSDNVVNFKQEAK